MHLHTMQPKVYLKAGEKHAHHVLNHDQHDYFLLGYWMFFHQDMNMIQERGEIFIKAWMDSGATGGSVGRLIGKDDGSYGFAVRFNTMKEYGAAQD